MADLPAGFTLDNAPPLPAGFTLDAPQTVGGAVQAGSSGFNSGLADVAGFPVDTGRNIIELGKAGAGFLYHEATGKQIPAALQPNMTPQNDVGGSEWIKAKIRDAGGTSLIDTGQPTTLNQYVHAGGEFAGQTAGGMAAGALAESLAHPAEPVPAKPPGTTTAADQASAPPTSAPEVPPPPPGFTVDAAPPATPDFTVPPAPASEARAQVLRDAGFSGKDVRTSALSGDATAAGTDFQTSKVNNAPGEVMSNTIEGERDGLQNFAGNLRDMSGGSSGLSSSDLYTRGQAIAAPIEQLSDHFDAAIQSAYTAANEKAAGTPIAMSSTDSFLTDNKSAFLGTVEGKQLGEGVQARMQDLGLLDAKGNVQPASVQQAEQLKQYLNDQWSPRTSRLIYQMKDAIDEDVTKAAGEDIYQQARQTRALRAKLLDDPTGIAKLAAPDDRLGINRAVPLERIPDYVASLPQDQFTHIVNTLRDVPAEIQPSAANALNEIRAHFANQIEAKGNSTQSMWNAKAVDEYLRQNGARMAQVYSPQELQQFKTLQDAGNILKMDRSYPGAEAQRYNLAARGVNVVGKGIHTGATAVGAHGGPVGAVVGHLAGAGIASKAEKFAENIAAGQARRRLTRL